MMEVGRVCVKLAGREAGERCVVVEVLDENYVVVAGPAVRRRRCNVSHLEPTPQILEIAKGATDEKVKEAFEKAGSG